MRRREIMGLFGAAVVLAGCGNTYTWNQKLTVTVNTPDGPRSGSSVVQVSATVGKPNILSQAVVSYKVSGEATVVDLGNGKYAFALLSGGDSYSATEYWASQCFSGQLVKGFDSGIEEKLAELFTKFKTFRDSCAMLGKKRPLMVTFADIAQPSSVQELDPENFDATFGAGFSLATVTLQIVDEPKSSKTINHLLGWLSEFPEPSLCKPKSGLDFSFCAAKVFHGDFFKG